MQTYDIKSTSPFNTSSIEWRETRIKHIAGLDVDVQLSKTSTRMIISLPHSLQRANAQRRSEYLAGRVCCADALHCLKLPVLVGRRGRAPIWPEGAVGSITHNESCAIAVVSTQHQRIGVDCATTISENILHLVAPHICRKEELDTCPKGLPVSEYVTLAFSAKESLYKALSHNLADTPNFLAANIRAVEGTSASLEFDGKTYDVLWCARKNEIITLFFD